MITQFKIFENEQTFKIGDYVKLMHDFVNGNPVKEISNVIFKIEKLSSPLILGKDNYYRLNHLDGRFFQWIPKKDLKHATEIEIDAIKYNM